jgi:hypothetical protein
MGTAVAYEEALPTPSPDLLPPLSRIAAYANPAYDELSVSCPNVELPDKPYFHCTPQMKSENRKSWFLSPPP